MTFLEAKLLSLFRACDDECKNTLLFAAQSISGIWLLEDNPTPAGVLTDLFPASGTAPDPDSVQTSSAAQRMIQAAQKAEIPVRYQMMLPEIEYLADLIRRDGDPFNALCFAFDYGFVKGNRATRRGKVKAL